MPTAAENQAPISSITINTPSATSSSSPLPIPNSDDADCDSQIVPIGAGVGAALGTLFLVATALFLWQCLRASQLQRELNEYRYHPAHQQRPIFSPRGTTAMNVETGYAPLIFPGTATGYSGSPTSSNEDGVKETSWKKFLRRNRNAAADSAGGGEMQQEVGGGEIVEMPATVASLSEGGPHQVKRKPAN